MKKSSLIQGEIIKSILFLALPIMGTSFVQMAYNLIDMIWIGKIGSFATAAVGSAGFYIWFATGFIFLCRIGAEVLVAQSIGEKNIKRAKEVVQNVMFLIILFGIIGSFVLIFFNEGLMLFFDIKELEVVNMGSTYLRIIGYGLIFFFVNPIFTAIFNGYGKSVVPFLINSIGLVFNIIFDPLLIFGIGIFPELGIVGAGIATIAAQGLVTLVFIIYILKNKDIHLFEGFKLFKKPDIKIIKKLLKIGMPVGLQSMLFTFFAMLIARIIADYGAVAIAVQKVGSQIESISWMTASGFSTATSTFVGQNFGAKKYDRISKGYFASLIMMGIFGIFTSVALVVFAEPLFKVFISEKDAVKEGVIYLRILGVSQFFMCIEIMTNGAFNGLGKTMIPSINSSIFTGLRVPFALILSATALSLSGVWWSITLSSILKGVVIVTMFIITLSKLKKSNKEVQV